MLYGAPKEEINEGGFSEIQCNNLKASSLSNSPVQTLVRTANVVLEALRSRGRLSENDTLSRTCTRLTTISMFSEKGIKLPDPLQ